MGNKPETMTFTAEQLQALVEYHYRSGHDHGLEYGQRDGMTVYLPKCPCTQQIASIDENDAATWGQWSSAADAVQAATDECPVCSAQRFLKG